MKRIILLALAAGLIFGCCGSVSAAPQSIEEQARELYRQGDLSYQQGRFQEAEDYFQKALQLIEQQKPASKQSPAGVSSQPARPAPVGGQKAEYIIGIDDVLNISVWQNPDLTQDAIVRPDGRISFPLVGDVQADGLTITEFDQKLTELLSEFVRSPEISISIRKLGGKKVMVLGEVKNPGVHSVTGSNTVVEAIAAAGGFTDHAVAASVILIRGGFDAPQAQRLNLTKALRGNPRLNPSLQTEDIVFVPKKFIANVNYFLGQVMEPLSRGFYIVDQLDGN